MKHSIEINFASYEDMKDFVGSFDAISDFLDYESPDVWRSARFSIRGTKVSEANSLEISHYFYNGSTGGFSWEKDSDGTSKLIRKGILNPRDRN